MNKKNRIIGIAVLLVGVIFIAALVWLMISKMYVLQSIVIQGNTTVSAEEIIEYAGIERGVSIFSVDKNKIRENLISSGLFEVTDIHTKLPSSLYITVEDRMQAALVLIGGRVCVIDNRGYVVRSLNYEPIRPSFYISGTGATSAVKGTKLNLREETLEALGEVLDSVYAVGASDMIKDINLSNLKDIRITTVNGMQVLLGDSSDSEIKMRWMVTALRDLEARGSIHGSLDVSSGTKADYKPGI